MGSIQNDRVRVAICGGGIAGASLFHAAQKHPHLDIHIFEAAPEFKDTGAAIGLTPNARRALELIGPSAESCLKRAGVVPQLGAEMLLAQGPDVGQSVGRMAGGCEVCNVHRATFVRHLLDDVPQERMHASKKLRAVDQTDSGPVTMQFEDGTQHECDVLIGADGIHSRARKYILGEDDPAAAPVPAGYFFIQVVKPLEQAAALLGTDHLNVDDPGETCWIGDGCLIFHNVLDDKQNVQFACAVSCSKDDPPKEWYKTVSADELRKTYAGFPARLYNAVDQLVCDQPEQRAYFSWEHLPARTYVRGAVCVVGDAAHATTPWQGSGAGMSIEDVMLLSSLLGEARSPIAARKALQVYSDARLARTHRIVASSNETGRMVTNRHPEADLRAEGLREKLRQKWDHIIYLDVAGHRDDALTKLRAELNVST